MLYYVLVLSSYVCDHAASLRVSVNADISTALKCLASGKRSIVIVPHCPVATRAVTILPLLLVYHCALYLWNVNFTTCAWSMDLP